LRRDFTINGLFYDPLEKKVHDWVGGEADLRARRIRTIGPPGERFAEDYLRLLRAVRFAARLGFTLEPDTLAALQQYAPRIRVISAERVREELVKLFAPPETPDRGQRLPRSALQSKAERPIGAPAARGLVLLRDSGFAAAYASRSGGHDFLRAIARIPSGRNRVPASLSDAGISAARRRSAAALGRVDA
jgi:hypothetical protein